MARTRIVLTEWLSSRLDTAGIPIELDDGDEPIIVPPADLWPAEAIEHISAGEYAQATRLILGETAHARFTAAGGTWRMLNRILLGDDQQAALPVEG